MSDAGADEVVAVVRMFARLRSGERTEVLRSMAEYIAARRSGGPEDWLAATARATFPVDHSAATLVTLAADVDPAAREALFAEGPVTTALSSALEDTSLGEIAYAGYEAIRARVDAMSALPAQAAVLGIEVHGAPGELWTESTNGCTHGDPPGDAEVRRRCVTHWASLIATWRSRCVDALLSCRGPQ